MPQPTGRGGNDTAGIAQPIGRLCPLGFPLEGDSTHKYFKQSDPEYTATVPVLCFATPEDAGLAGYSPAHP